MEPEKKYKQPPHGCLNLRGKGQECLKCEIMARGFCNDLIEILTKMVSNLSSYEGIPPEDRDEILSDTVIGVWKGIDKFEGRNGALFSTWAWAIFKNKRRDYFRRLPSEDVVVFLFLDDHRKKEEIEMMVSEKESSSSRDEEEMEHIIECLKKNIDNDPGGCIHLYLNLFCSGKDRKVLAEEYGLKLNTFNQRVRRCRKVIRDLCRG